MPSTTPQSLRILCFGASITAGFYNFGLSYHPYARALETTLRKHLPPSTALAIEVDGEPGDILIGGRYWTRLKRQLWSSGGTAKKDQYDDDDGGGITGAPERMTTWNPKNYDWVIIQAGGNDLGSLREPEEIYTELSKVYDYIFHPSSSFLGSGIVEGTKIPRVLALTVTETSSHFVPSVRKRYDALNDLLRNHKQEGYHVADVCKAVPFETMHPNLRKRVWDDGLHLKAAGYDMFGEFVGGRLAEIIANEEKTKINDNEEGKGGELQQGVKDSEEGKAVQAKI